MADAEVRKDISTVAPGDAAGLNALAFTGGIFDATHWAANCLRMLRAGGD
jgi:hypothetical protein